MDVCSLSGRVTINPYPHHYSAAFASSILSTPHLHQRALRLRLPETFGRRYRISTFRAFDSECRRSTLSTGGNIVRVEPRSRGPNHPRTFWSKPISPFGLFAITAVTGVHIC
jgi:hypothetical protein